MSAREVIAAVLLVAGVGVLATCTLGVVLMRSALDRLHCVSAASFGVLLIAIAMVVQESFSLIGNQALGAAVLLLFTTPVLSHATARTIRIRRHGDWAATPDEREHG